MMRLLAKKYFSRSSIVNMSGDNYKRKNQSSLKHLFDFSDLNVYDTSVINLSVGAPGKQDLEKCCDLFERATKHRMVIFYCFLYLSIEETKIEITKQLLVFQLFISVYFISIFMALSMFSLG